MTDRTDDFTYASALGFYDGATGNGLSEGIRSRYGPDWLQVYENSRRAGEEYIRGAQAKTLQDFSQHLKELGESARENGYEAQGCAVQDMADEALERADKLLRPDSPEPQQMKKIRITFTAFTRKAITREHEVPVDATDHDIQVLADDIYDNDLDGSEGEWEALDEHWEKGPIKWEDV